MNRSETSPPNLSEAYHRLSSSKYSIAIIDDHSIIRAVFRSLAEDDDQLEMIWCAKSLAEGRAALHNKEPDLLILDVSLPDGLGYEILPYLNEKHPNTKVLMVSSHEEREFSQKAHEMGAKGYLTKNSSLNDLTVAIHHILNDKKYFRPEVLVRQGAALNS